MRSSRPFAHLFPLALAAAGPACSSSPSYGPGGGDASTFTPHVPQTHYPAPSTCPSHADAGAHDACTTASDCPPGQGCMCGDQFPGNLAIKANQCVPAACASDADCGAGRYCSASIVPLCGGTGTNGFYCHTAADACDDGRDCAIGSCTFTGAAWGCVKPGCAG